VTLFEYLAIAFSLVFSFAALRLVAGLPHAIAANRRYNVHVTHVFILLFATAAVFWAFWSARNVEWTFPRFLIQLAGPAALYFLACTLIPDEPVSVMSWRDYYFAVRRRYFGDLHMGTCPGSDHHIALGLPPTTRLVSFSSNPPHRSSWFDYQSSFGASHDRCRGNNARGTCDPDPVSCRPVRCLTNRSTRPLARRARGALAAGYRYRSARTAE
jgi:hypothetical protein